jgi:metal-sulfur cluster biosynthetic enzyme
MTGGSIEARRAEVLARLGRVNDPELDESVTELGFVTEIAVDTDGGVRVGFRLPTYWCAANFAFLMADDMRREVLALPWVTGLRLELGEHMYADAINRGMAHNLSFQESFGAEASGDLDDLRRTFLQKAFQRRQEALLRHLLAAGHAAEAVVSLTVAALRAVNVGTEGWHLRRRYLELRNLAAPFIEESAAFVEASGKPVAAADLQTYLQTLRRIGTNAEFNGALCRGLLAARFNEPVREPGAEPTLLDFARMPPRAGEGPRVAG